MNIMKRIHQMTCNHTDADGNSLLKFVGHRKNKFNGGMDDDRWTEYTCKHCGQTVHKDGHHEPEYGSEANEAYFDRNQAAMALAYATLASGGEAGIKTDPEWPILFIELPTGQVTWHIPADEINQDAWPKYKPAWDQHTMEQKRQRLAAYMYGVA